MPAGWRRLLKTYLQETTVHGLRYLADSDTVLGKAFWWANKVISLEKQNCAGIFYIIYFQDHHRRLFFREYQGRKIIFLQKFALHAWMGKLENKNLTFLSFHNFCEGDMLPPDQPHRGGGLLKSDRHLRQRGAGIFTRPTIFPHFPVIGKLFFFQVQEVPFPAVTVWSGLPTRPLGLPGHLLDRHCFDLAWEELWVASLSLDLEASLEISNLMFQFSRKTFETGVPSRCTKEDTEVESGYCIYFYQFSGAVRS